MVLNQAKMFQKKLKLNIIVLVWTSNLYKLIMNILMPNIGNIMSPRDDILPES